MVIISKNRPHIQQGGLVQFLITLGLSNVRWVVIRNKENSLYNNQRVFFSIFMRLKIWQILS